MNVSEWRSWRLHFDRNAARPLPPAEADAFLLRGDERLRADLLRTLTLLQRAETGEGRIAKAIEKVHYANIDGDYRAALKGFVCEEARHAGVLGRLLGAYGVRPAARSWRDGAFEGIRGLAGVRLKLFVFLVAEVAAVFVFESVAERLPRSSMRRVLRRLAHDEEHHLRFHAQFFRSATPHGALRGLLAIAVWIAGLCACIAMWLDHRALLRRLGLPGSRILHHALHAATHARQHVLGVGARAPSPGFASSRRVQRASPRRRTMPTIVRPSRPNPMSGTPRRSGRWGAAEHAVASGSIRAVAPSSRR